MEDEDGGSAVVVEQSWDDLFQGVPATEGDDTIEVAGRRMACTLRTASIWSRRTGSISRSAIA